MKDKEQIELYERIFSNDSNRYFILGSLVTSDGLYSIEDYNKRLEQITFVKTHIDEMNIHDDVKKEVIKYVKKAEKILKKEMKDFGV